jgi:tetratricopeptide (TPR) repeat protein
MLRRLALLSLTIAWATAIAFTFRPDLALADDANTAKARELVQAAIKMTNSDEAVKLLWQATDLDPTYDEAYIYLGLYYQARSDPADMVKVYQKLIKYEPKQVSAYLNVGEAYMTFQPPKTDDAMVYFRKAFDIDHNSFAALRIGQLFAQQGNRDEAVKYLRIALADSSKNPTVSAEAEKTLKEIGAL